MNKTIGLTIILVLILIIGGVLIYNSSAENNAVQKENATGKVFFSLTDQTADITNVDDVKLSVDRVEMYNQTKGWVVVSAKNTDFNLLALKVSGQAKLIGQVDVPANTYSKVRLVLNNVYIQTTSGDNQEAILPSKNFEIDGDFKVTENTASNINFDVHADQSLHLTSNATYVFTPVITTTIKSKSDVVVDGDNTVTSNGSVDSTINAGMDTTGNVNLNTKVSTDISLDISDGGDVVVAGGGNGLVQINTESDALMDNNENINASNTPKIDSSTNLTASTTGSVNINL